MNYTYFMRLQQKGEGEVAVWGWSCSFCGDVRNRTVFKIIEQVLVGVNRGAHFLPDVVAATVLAGDGVGFEVDRGLREAAEVDVDGLGAFVIEFVVAVVVLLLLGSQGGGAVAGEVVRAVVVEKQVKFTAAFGAGEKVARTLGDDEALSGGKGASVRNKQPLERRCK